MDCSPLDKFIQEQNPDDANVSNGIEIVAKRHAVSLLIKGDTEGYREFLLAFSSLGIIDYRPCLASAIFGKSVMEQNPIRLSLSNCLYDFKKDSFCRQREMSEYLRTEFRRGRTRFKEEFDTGHGRCDFLIKADAPFLLELKPAKIIRKDIYQCVAFHKYQDGQCPVVILGYGIDTASEQLAKEHNIDVYLYRLKTVAPVQMEIRSFIGDKYPPLEREWSLQFLGDYAGIAKDLGWSP